MSIKCCPDSAFIPDFFILTFFLLFRLSFIASAVGPDKNSTMGSSYWPRHEVANTNTPRYYAVQSSSSLVQSEPSASVNAENQQPAYKEPITYITRQPTTSEMRTPMPGYNARFSTSPDPPPSIMKERATTWNASHGGSIDYSPLEASYFTRHRLAFGACVPILYAIAELLMLIYFLDLYLSLPRGNSDKIPQISLQYSIWPYISCMGSLNLVAFKAFSFIISFFFIATFSVDLYFSWNNQPGYWLRRTRVVMSLLWGALFIWLAFASKNVSSHVHLYLVSIKAIACITIKTMTWLIGHLERKEYPSLRMNRTAAISQRWKQIVILCALRKYHSLPTT